MSDRKILLIGAMDRELRELLAFYQCLESGRLQGIYPIWRSKMRHPFKIMVLQTFVGEINASIATTSALCECDPDYVFKIGCVGANTEGLHIGDVIMPLGFFSTTSWITRSGVDNKPTPNASDWQSVFGNKPYQVNSNNLGGQPYYFEPDLAIAKKYKNYFQKLNKKLVNCYVGGGNIWCFDLEYARNVAITQIPSRSQYRSWVADMESYAIAQTCNVFKKPFMGFYRISDNFVEKEEYLPNSVAQLFDKQFIMNIDMYLRTLV